MNVLVLDIGTSSMRGILFRCGFYKDSVVQINSFLHHGNKV